MTGFYGHVPVRHAVDDWKCSCGTSLSGGPFGKGRRGAYDVMKFHRLDLKMQRDAAAMGTADSLDAPCPDRGCNEPPVIRGMCKPHYDYWIRNTPAARRAASTARKGVAPTPAEKRFWQNVEKGDGCWLWTGARNQSGYGVIRVDNERRAYGAHSYSLELATGQRCPEGMYACHHCDNKPCVNPAHLYYGTPKQNTADAVARGRLQVGSANYRARLTEAQVLDIRQRYASGAANTIQLASEFDIAKSAIQGICSGNSWKHVGGPIARRTR